MNIKNIKPGDKVKIKTKSPEKIRSSRALDFWKSCGGKIFKVILVDYYRDSVYLDFKDVYTPKVNGAVDILSIERIIPKIHLQDDLFRL
ncbi:MAG: hypothetical protein ACOCP4_03705 [Candidatus Woesearchaeota archaeon]